MFFASALAITQRADCGPRERQCQGRKARQWHASLLHHRLLQLATIYSEATNRPMLRSLQGGRRLRPPMDGLSQRSCLFVAENMQPPWQGIAGNTGCMEPKFLQWLPWGCLLSSCGAAFYMSKCNLGFHGRTQNRPQPKFRDSGGSPFLDRRQGWHLPGKSWSSDRGPTFRTRK